MMSCAPSPAAARMNLVALSTFGAISAAEFICTQAALKILLMPTSNVLAGGSGSRLFGGWLLQQWRQLARAVQSIQLIASADMLPVDENLGNRGATAGPLAHLGPQLAVGHDVDLLVGHTPLFQQLLGTPAIRTQHGGVDFNAGHASVRSLCDCRASGISWAVASGQYFWRSTANLQVGCWQDFLGTSWGRPRWV